MTTDLPPSGASTEEDHAQMSQRFLEHARIELDKGHRLQASEKVWGAVAHALKAVGEKRRWGHEGHQNLIDISVHLGKEFDRDRDFYVLRTAARGMHRNFYENDTGEGDIRYAMELAGQFVEQLRQVPEAPPRPFRIETPEDQHRLGRLLKMPRQEVRRRLPLGTTDPRGFSRNPDDNGAGAGPTPAGGRPSGPSDKSGLVLRLDNPAEGEAAPGRRLRGAEAGRQRRPQLSKPQLRLPTGSGKAEKPKSRTPWFFKTPRLPRKRP